MATSAAKAKTSKSPVSTAKSAPAKKASAKAVVASEVKKAAAKPVVAVSAKAASKPVAKKATRKAVSPEQRAAYIETAAYYIAERRGFDPSSVMDDWLVAEAEIDRLIAEGRLGA